MEFLRTSALSCALYQGPVGSNDLANAHEEELYLMLTGHGRLCIGASEHPLAPGTLRYVRAACDHAFFAIEEATTARAFFGAPPRGPSRR